jgi:ABC-type glutathione transport system ATPase component
MKNADDLAYKQMLLQGLHGARVRNHEEILASLLELRPEHLAELIDANAVDDLEEQCSFGAERTRRILEAFKANLDPFALEIIDIEDRVSIELNVGNDTEPNFKDAAELSRGQKCTALLPLLLARRETPLLVDQPEDNLDNHFIYETVVETVRRLKSQRQMFFVTHNANIPVLGEADLVIVMDSNGRKGYVARSGSVDSCRTEIIDLLEGGREAFDLRRQRYERR